MTDEYGNEIRVDGSEVLLTIEGGRKVLLGRIYMDGSHRVLITVRNSEKHTYRKLNAYGFNAAVMRELDITHIKLVEDHKNVYYIPVEALKSDKRRKYNQQYYISKQNLKPYQTDGND